jgi:hypothetical protein
MVVVVVAATVVMAVLMTMMMMLHRKRTSSPTDKVLSCIRLPSSDLGPGTDCREFFAVFLRPVTQFPGNILITIISFHFLPNSYFAIIQSFDVVFSRLLAESLKNANK